MSTSPTAVTDATAASIRVLRLRSFNCLCSSGGSFRPVLSLDFRYKPGVPSVMIWCSMNTRGARTNWGKFPIHAPPPYRRTPIAFPQLGVGDVRPRSHAQAQPQPRPERPMMPNGSWVWGPGPQLVPVTRTIATAIATMSRQFNHRNRRSMWKQPFYFQILITENRWL